MWVTNLCLKNQTSHSVLISFFIFGNWMRARAQNIKDWDLRKLRLTLISCDDWLHVFPQIPVLADLPVGENLLDHVFVDIPFLVDGDIAITPQRLNSWSTNLQYKLFGTGLVFLRISVHSHTWWCSDALICLLQVLLQRLQLAFVAFFVRNMEHDRQPRNRFPSFQGTARRWSTAIFAIHPLLNFTWCRRGQFGHVQGQLGIWSGGFHSKTKFSILQSFAFLHFSLWYTREELTKKDISRCSWNFTMDSKTRMDSYFCPNCCTLVVLLGTSA